MSLMEYLSDRREGFLERWHSENTIRKESLAEHQWFVTRNAILICQSLRFYHIAEPDVESCIRMALFHDESELDTGDVNGYAKRAYPNVKLALDEAENLIIEGMYSKLPEKMAIYMTYPLARYQRFNEYDMEAQIVKYCDVLDAHIFTEVEITTGNEYMKLAWSRTKEWIEALTWPWLVELRKVSPLLP